MTPQSCHRAKELGQLIHVLTEEFHKDFQIGPYILTGDMKKSVGFQAGFLFAIKTTTKINPPE